MPRGPQGQKRPADVIGAAIQVAKIATGEVSETTEDRNPAAIERGRIGGVLGGKERSKRLSAIERKAIAQKAARARWKS